jgi:F-type H+-transporting ATPase subunit b
MKRLVLAFALILAPAFAQEAEHKAAEHKSEAAEPSIMWKWANFALLAGILGYLGSKQAGPFFAQRDTAIRSGLQDAQRLRAESEARVTAIEKRVANLETEMNSLRESAKKEMVSEADRIRTETTKAIEKIQAHAQLEIESAAKIARQELRSYSADLAIQLATSTIRERITSGAHDQLIQNFVSQLHSQKAVN